MAYQVLKEDDKHFMVQHPDGSHFRVAKKGLTPSTLKKISGMQVQHKAYGGEIMQPDMETPSPEPAYEAPSVPSPQPGPSPMVVEQNQVQPQAAPPQMPQTYSQPRMPSAQVNPYAGLGAEMQGIQNQALGAVGMETKAEVQKAKDIEGAYKKNIQETQDIQAQYKQKYDKLDAEHEALTKSYGDGSIDPKRFWNNLGTTNKVMASLGIFFGGIGSGITGQPNAALQVVQNAIDRDIDSQKANLGKTANLLSMNMQKYGNIHQAEMATRLNANAALQATVAQMTAKAAAPEAMARGQQLMAQLKMQGLQQKRELAMTQAVAGMASGQNQNINPEYLPKEVKERVVQVPGPDGSLVAKLAYSKEGAEKLRPAIAATNMIKQKVDEALQFMDEKGASPGIPFVWQTKDKARAESIRDSLLNSMSQLHDLNRLTEQELDIYKSMIPSPGQWNQTAAKEKFNYVSQLIQHKLNSSFATELEGYNPGGIKEAPPNLGGKR